MSKSFSLPEFTPGQRWLVEVDQSGLPVFTLIDPLSRICSQADSDAQILSFLQIEGSATVSEIARKFREIRSPERSSALSRLERAGMVKRQSCFTGGRSQTRIICCDFPNGKEGKKVIG